MKDLAKGGIAGTVVLVIVVTIAFMVSGADFLKAGPEGVEIGNNPEPDSTSVSTIDSTGDGSVSIIGDGAEVTVIESNVPEEKIDKLVEGQEKIVRNQDKLMESQEKLNSEIKSLTQTLGSIGITDQIDPYTNIFVPDAILSRIDATNNEISDLQTAFQKEELNLELDYDYLRKSASAYLYSGNFERALEILYYINSENPGDFEVKTDIGTVSLRYGDYTTAINWYDDALQANPNHILAHTNKGIALTNLGNYNAAIFSYDRALKLDPSNIKSLEGKGSALIFLDRNQEAYTIYSSLVKIDTNNILAWYNLGVLSSNSGSYYQAVEFFDKVLSIDPNYLDAYEMREQIVDYLNNQ